MRKNGLIIAIDGPAGVGKSTVSAHLAEKLAYSYIITGFMYRAVGLKALMGGVPFDNHDKITEIAENLNLTFNNLNGHQVVILDSSDITDNLQTESVGNTASIVSQIQGVRDALGKLQRALGSLGGVVMEGRDIGTHIFPDAEVKFFLTAKIEERAKRRFLQLLKKGKNVNFDEILGQISERDKKDKERSIAPLIMATDAILVDNTELNVDEVVNLMIDSIDKKI